MSWQCNNPKLLNSHLAQSSEWQRSRHSLQMQQFACHVEVGLCDLPSGVKSYEFSCYINLLCVKLSFMFLRCVITFSWHLNLRSLWFCCVYPKQKSQTSYLFSVSHNTKRSASHKHLIFVLKKKYPKNKQKWISEWWHSTLSTINFVLE